MCKQPCTAGPARRKMVRHWTALCTMLCRVAPRLRSGPKCVANVVIVNTIIDSCHVSSRYGCLLMHTGGLLHSNQGAVAASCEIRWNQSQ